MIFFYYRFYELYKSYILESFIHLNVAITAESLDQIRDSYGWINEGTTLNVNRIGAELLFRHYCYEDNDFIHFKYLRLALFLCHRIDPINSDEWRTMYGFLAHNVLFLPDFRMTSGCAVRKINLHDIHLLDCRLPLTVVFCREYLIYFTENRFWFFFDSEELQDLNKMFETDNCDRCVNYIADNYCKSKAIVSCDDLLNIMMTNVKNGKWSIDWHSAPQTGRPTLKKQPISMVCNVSSVIRNDKTDIVSCLTRLESLWDVNNEHLNYTERFVYGAGFVACIALNNVLGDEPERPIGINVCGG